MEMSRRTSFSLNTSTAAFTRSLGGGHELDHLVALPGDGGVGAAEVEAGGQFLAAWFSALSTSWRSTLLTMSNDESAMGCLLRIGAAGSPGRFASGYIIVVPLLTASNRVLGFDPRQVA